MPKGRKTCPKCNNDVGSRAYVCEKCRYLFLKLDQEKDTALPRRKKRRKIKERIKDFSTLVKGDRILVKGGPVYECEDGTLTYMGSRGYFNVVKVEENGIVAYGADSGGYAYLYTGPTEKSKLTGVTNRPHKIFKIYDPREWK